MSTSRHCTRFLLLVAVSLASCRDAHAPRPQPAATALERIQSDARALDGLVTTPFAHRFLAATAALPHVAPRVVFHTADKEHWYTASEAGALTPEQRQSLVRVEVDEEVYYSTRYGSPLSYARALDLLAAANELPATARRLLDFGYGYVGHLRLLASLGFDVTGVDVDPMLRALYAEPSDQGEVPGFSGAPTGSVRLLDGRFPADPSIRRAAGTGYEVILAKNVLKKGYIHPDRPSDPKYLIDLGLDDATFLAALHDALGPHGAMLIYNVCPALTPPDKPFVPWSDGRSPFSKAQWVSARFDVLAFDVDDTRTFRLFAKALGWDTGEDAMDLEHDLSVLYTLVARAD